MVVLTVPKFPFHYSLPTQVSCFSKTLRTLNLANLRFTHLTEFRRFVTAFKGLASITIFNIEVGIDKLGDLRPLHGSGCQGLSIIHIRPQDDESSKGEFWGKLPLLWVAGPQSSHRMRPAQTQLQSRYASLSLGFVRAFIPLLSLFIPEEIRWENGITGMISDSACMFPLNNCLHHH